MEAGGWEARTTSYAYAIVLGERQELVAYHYHPTGTSPATFPHMHVKNLTAPIYLGKAHFPTGTVSVEAVLRFAIEELGVQPLQPD